MMGTAHSGPKHVEKRNKHTKKNCAPSWLYLQDYFIYFKNTAYPGGSLTALYKRFVHSRDKGSRFLSYVPDVYQTKHCLIPKDINCMLPHLRERQASFHALVRMSVPLCHLNLVECMSCWLLVLSYACYCVFCHLMRHL